MSALHVAPIGSGAAAGEPEITVGPSFANVLGISAHPRFRFSVPKYCDNLEVALAWAIRGIRVFPCQHVDGPQQKAPLPGLTWQDRSTTSSAQIEAWWSRNPDALVGINLVDQRVIIIDVDGEEGERQWRELTEKHGEPGAPYVKTPGGGRHFGFKLPPGVDHGNSLGSLTPKKQGGKIDVRGPGFGYVIAAGSMLPDGRSYKAVAGDLTCLSDDAQQIPEWLLTILKGRYVAPDASSQPLLDAPRANSEPPWEIRSAPSPTARDVRDHPRVQRWAEEGFNRELDAVRGAGKGGRNIQLNDSAFNIGQLVGGGFVDRSMAENALWQAAVDNGYAGEEGPQARKTIRSGLDGGEVKPRDIPTAIVREIEDSQEMEALGRRASARALARAADGTIHDAETGEIIEPPAPQLGQQDARLPLTHFDEIDLSLDLQDFVQGVLLEGSSAVVYGASNTGKTFWVTDLALHVAAGMPWNNRRVEGGGVVYLALEGGFGFKNRVAAWKAHHRCDDIPFAAIMAPLSLRDAKDVSLLTDRVGEAEVRFGCPTKLIVIDTLSRAMAGGDENSSADMGRIVQGIDALRAATGAAVLVIHHSGKNAGSGARGHSLLLGAVDTEVEVTVDEASAFRTANITKQRDAPKGVAISFRLDAMFLGKNRHGEEVTTCLVVPGDQNHLAVNDRRKKTGEKVMPVRQQTLLRAIETLVIDQGEMGWPAPGMPEVRLAKRAALHARLIVADWLQLEDLNDDDMRLLRSGLLPIGVKIPDREYKRLGNNLEALKSKGKIGFDRERVWLI